MKVINTIQKRGSIRTYQQDAQLDFSKLEPVIERINETSGPFGQRITVTLVSSGEDSAEMKLGTYGMIKGASDYLVVTIGKSASPWLDLGYLFEEVILEATALGFGTVWMAGTFSRKHFKQALALTEEQVIPIVSPIGVAASSKSFVNKYIAKSKTHVRKPFGELFLNAGCEPLEQDGAKLAHIALEMVRLAPSALNKQPWRVIEEGNEYHFYNNASSEKSQIDIGIAIYHFIKSAEELGLEVVVKQATNQLLPNYITTLEIFNN